MERVIGLDMGFGFNKSNDGRESKVFPSVVGEGTTGGFGMSSLGFNRPTGTNDLRVTIGGRTYFLGDLAVRHSRIAHRGLSATRAEGDDIKILFLGALSQYCREPVNDFTVVTGLPPGRMHLADDLIRRLKGDHTVIRHQGSSSNEYTIRLERIEVVPQPLGTYWAEVLDSRGQLRTDSRLLGGKVGVIDVGFRTTDFASIIDGEYAPSWSRTVPIGISTGYDGIAAQLHTQYNLERETFALDQAVIGGQINISGRTVDISQLRDQVLGDVATKLLVEVQSLWQLAEYDAVLLTGGGGHVLERYLRPLVPQSVLVNDPVTANARGYYAWGAHHQQQASGQQPAPQPATRPVEDGAHAQRAAAPVEFESNN